MLVIGFKRKHTSQKLVMKYILLFLLIENLILKNNSIQRLLFDENSGHEWVKEIYSGQQQK